MAETAPSTVYIASLEGDTGKSTVALGLLHMLSATTPRVGVFRPITRSSHDRDYILELLLEHCTADIDYQDAIGATYEQVHADPDAAIGEIVMRFHEVAKVCDAVVIVGTDYTDIAGPSELRYNARIAANLGAPVLLVVRGAGRDPDEVVEITRVCEAELAREHAQLTAVIANRCDPGELEAVEKALAVLGHPAWTLPEVPLLTAPTMHELCEAIEGEVYSGDPELLQREALRVMVGGMTAEHILERLADGVAVIVPGDRSDVLLALVNAHEAEGFPSLSGIIMNGGMLPEPAIERLIRGLKPKLPILTTQLGTFDTASAAAHTRGRVSLTSMRKVDTALALMEQRVDSRALRGLIEVPVPSVVTRQMFEYQLVEWARVSPSRIVLPEGDDDRILRAAGRV
ncbi:MAG: AAA family ATPase, partial [Nocardia sp.]|nr:AAA family ATPase [Nocardia sp.]